MPSSLHDAAQRYASMGYRVFPLAPGSKDQPLTTHGHLDASDDLDVISAWWKRTPNANIGINAEGLVVVDTDPGSGDWPGADRAQDFAACPIQRTPRGGKHVVFSANGGKYKISESKVAPKVDIRCDGGFFTVAPSARAEGAYAWATPLEPREELPPVPKWLHEALRAAERAEAKADSKPSSNGDGWPTGERNGRLTAMGGRLRRAGLSSEAIAAALQQVNVERCKPPLSESDVQKIAASVGRYEAGKEPEAAGFEAEIDYGFRTAADLIREDHTVEWLVDYVLADAQPAILAGPKKTLKTSVAVDLCVSLATARPFLGRFHVPRARRVALMSGESGAATLAETLERIATAANVDPRGLTNLLVSERLPQIGDLNHHDAMLRTINDHELEVCVVDPAYMAMSAAADGMANMFKVGSVLRMLNDLTDKTGCMFCLLHHSKKAGPQNDQYAPPELEGIAWSGFQEWARQWLLLGRRERYEPGSGLHKLWLSCGGSAGHGSSWGLDVDEGTRAEGQTRYWAVDLTPASELVSNERERRASGKDQERAKVMEANALAILKFLRREGPVLQSAVQKNVLDGRPFHTAWQWLIDNQQIRQAGTTKASNSRTCKLWEVAESCE